MTPEQLMELRRQRGQLIKESRAVLDGADKEKGLTAEERNKYEAMSADIDQLTVRMDLEERQKGFEGLLLQGAENADPEAAEQRNTELLDPRATAEYRQAFEEKYLRAAKDQIETRALVEATDSAGGFLVPTDYEREIIRKLDDAVVIRQLASVMTAGHDRVLNLQGGIGTSDWVPEGGAYPESDADFSQGGMSAYKLGSIIKISEELLQDSAVNMPAYIAEILAQRNGRKSEEAFISGNGTGKPTGILTTAQNGATATAALAITSDELLELYYSVRQEYGRAGTWLMNRDVVKMIRQLKDSAGRYIYQPGLKVGEPDSMEGRPIVQSAYMPTVAANAKVIAFGDFKRYQIVDRAGIAMRRLDELYAVNGQVGFRVSQRMDGKLLVPEAIKTLTMGAT